MRKRRKEETTMAKRIGRGVGAEVRGMRRSAPDPERGGEARTGGDLEAGKIDVVAGEVEVGREGGGVAVGTGGGAEVARIAEAGAEVEVETGETEAEIGGLRRALAVLLAGIEKRGGLPRAPPAAWATCTASSTSETSAPPALNNHSPLRRGMGGLYSACSSVRG